VEDVAERAQRLKKYLLGKEPKEKMSQIPDTEEFLDQKITALLDKVGGA
jgi:hypothetical protein